MIAVIPARGGSKGLQGKNIRSLNSKPLIAYSIEAALAATCIDRVIVSTDCQEIATVARQYGAEVPFLRPKELGQDDSRAIDVYRHCIEWLSKEWGETINEFAVLLPTCPLRTSLDIENAFATFRANNASSVISYTEEHHPITWHQYIDENNKFERIFDISLNNRQKERPSYFPNGAIFLFTREIIASGTYYDNNSYAYIMPRKRSVDVDTLDDFEYIEFLMSK